MYRLLFAALASLLLWTGIAAAADWPPSAPDLAISILPFEAVCPETEDCRFLVRIENTGDADYSGAAAFLETTAAPAVLGTAGDGLWTCRKLDFGDFACAIADVHLKPGQISDTVVTLRLLPTPRAETEVCASLDWQATGWQARDQALRMALEAAGAKAPESAVPDVALAGMFGSWGDGDRRSGNDKHCATLAIGFTSPPPTCTGSAIAFQGACVELSAWCTGGRDWDAAGNRCACPAAKPSFDSLTRTCAAAVAQPSCTAGRTASGGSCFCPAAQPLWNATANACEAFPAPAPASVQVEKPKPPKQVVKVEPVPAPKPVAPKTRVATPRVKICARGRVLEDGLCVRQKRHASARPQRRAVKAAPGRTCPPFFIYNSRRDYCWPALWIDPDVLAHGPILRKRK